jgi:hypothetical protein
VIRLAISPAAYRAIAATLASSVGVEPQRAPNGDYFIWLDPAVILTTPAEVATFGWRRTRPRRSNCRPAA